MLYREIHAGDFVRVYSNEGCVIEGQAENDVVRGGASKLIIWFDPYNYIVVNTNLLEVDIVCPFKFREIFYVSSEERSKALKEAKLGV